MAGELERLRAEVERLSLDLLRVLGERGRAVLEIGREKRRIGLPVRDPYREAQLLDRLVAQNPGPFEDATVRSFFRRVFDACAALLEDSGRRALRVAASSGPPVHIEVRGVVLGPSAPPVYIAGPCSIESAEQLDAAARGLAALGVRFFRAGAYKPRTSPHSFGGLGQEGLALLREVGRRYDLVTVTEATAPANVPLVAEYADVIQVGARNMFNYELLREVGRTGRPVLLKRSFGATFDEWLHAAEYVALGGSERIILCERGIRTFARETRATLDLAAVPLALAATRLPVVVDVSHAAGRRDLLAPLARAAFAVGAHGVMIEVHPDPSVALSDAEQQIDLAAFAALARDVREALGATAAALGR